MQTMAARRPALTTYEQLRALLVKAALNWNEDRIPRLSASLAFYAVLSLAPLLVLSVAIVGPLLGGAAVRARMFREAAATFGRGAAQFLDSLITSAAHPGASILAGLISLLLALYGASSLFLQLEDSVNAIWRVEPRRGALRAFIVGRAVSISMVLVSAMIVFAWLAIDSWLGFMVRHAGIHGLWRTVSVVLSFFFMLGVCSISFKSLPHRMVAWIDVLPGSLVAALGFVISKLLLSLYFTYSSVSSAYGSAGAMVVILLWTYYMAQVFFFGLEMTYVYAHEYGSQLGRHPREDGKVRA